MLSLHDIAYTNLQKILLSPITSSRTERGSFLMDIARASIKRTVVVLFICFLIALGGISAYQSIGKLEDPAFTIKTAVVSIIYPGSTVYEAEQEAASRM